MARRLHRASLRPTAPLARAAAGALGLLTACQSGGTTATGGVEISGVVTQGPASVEPAPGATLVLRDEDFVEQRRTVADDDGAFTLFALPGAVVHLEVDGGEGTVRAAFRGETGLLDRFVVPEGQLFVVSDEALEAERAAFAGCPGSDLPGVIFGTIRLDLGQGLDNPAERFSFARALDLDRDAVEACYLDEAGVYDPDAMRTGLTGRFAIFGVQGGPLELVFGRDTLGGTLLTREQVYVPEGGVVARPAALVPL